MNMILLGILSIVGSLCCRMSVVVVVAGTSMKSVDGWVAVFAYVYMRSNVFCIRSGCGVGSYSCDVFRWRVKLCDEVVEFVVCRVVSVVAL